MPWETTIDARLTSAYDELAAIANQYQQLGSISQEHDSRLGINDRSTLEHRALLLHTLRYVDSTVGADKAIYCQELHHEAGHAGRRKATVYGTETREHVGGGIKLRPSLEEQSQNHKEAHNMEDEGCNFDLGQEFGAPDIERDCDKQDGQHGGSELPIGKPGQAVVRILPDHNHELQNGCIRKDTSGKRGYPPKDSQPTGYVTQNFLALLRREFADLIWRLVCHRT